MKKLHRRSLCSGTGYALGLFLVAHVSSAQFVTAPPVYRNILDEEGIEFGRVEIARLPALSNREINESSGVAFSLIEDGVLWTHNDSGDTARLFALDTNGNHLGVFHLKGTTAYDWEDMASCRIDGVPTLVLADIGDNDRVRDRCVLYLVEEPVLDPANSPAEAEIPVRETIRFVYEDGPHDCEAMGIDPQTGDFYLVTKERRQQAGVYRIQRSAVPPEGNAVARKLMPFDLHDVTAMDIASDGHRAVVLTYDDAYEYQRPKAGPWPDAFAFPPVHLPMPWRKQGESICYGEDTRTLYLTSEHAPAAFWRVRVQPPAP